MYFLKSKWRHMRWPERIAFLAGIPCAAIVMFLALLHIACIRTTSLPVYAALIVLIMLSQAVLHWRKNRKAAIVSLSTAVFVIAAYVLVFVI